MDGKLYITQHNDTFEIKVSSDAVAKSVDVEGVLDFDQMHRIIGLEIINLKFHAGTLGLEKLQEHVRPAHNEAPKFSYDEDVDAFYLTISHENSMNQIATDVKILLNEKNQIIGFQAKIC